MPQVGTSQVIRFATFEVDLLAQELRKGGLRLKLTGQPFQVLAILLERPGTVVTREELQKRLWPDTFVDVDHNLNTAINKIREVLGDSAESPRYVETLPRRGYRFIAPVDGRDVPETAAAAKMISVSSADAGVGSRPLGRLKVAFYSIVAVSLILVAGTIFLIHNRSQPSRPLKPRALARLTFDDGVQMEPTWSPDGRFIAYSSDRGGKLDIWVRQVGGGDPVQVTHGSANSWQPNWSPNGKYIAYRSEGREAGLFIIPALGGIGLERRITTFGYKPRWSPDGTQILFQALIGLPSPRNSFHVVGLDGGPPREILAEFVAEQHVHLGSVMWQPGGKNFSVWTYASGLLTVPSPRFWTVPVSGGAAIAWQIPPEIAKQLDELSVSGAVAEKGAEYNFSWAPSSTAIYFARDYKGATNIWKASIDLQTKRVMTMERLTVGPGADTEPAVSPDGRLAFAAKSKSIRVWLFPFDAANGRLSGQGLAATSPEMEAWSPNLSADGTKLAYCVSRGGQWELWEKSLVDGHEYPIFADDYLRELPQWSHDGKRLFYRRSRMRSGVPEGQLVVWSEELRSEKPLTQWSNVPGAPYDWSPDDKWALASMWKKSVPAEVWQFPADAGHDAAVEARKIVSHPRYNLYQPHVSPNGRWIVFEAVDSPPATEESIIYVMPQAGGEWVRITEKNHWSDKPRWSLDGKGIYYVTDQNGFLNVWGTRFNPAAGKPIGKPFQVTAFNTPSMMFPSSIEGGEISLGRGRLALTLEQTSGSIWVLDNVDR